MHQKHPLFLIASLTLVALLALPLTACKERVEIEYGPCPGPTGNGGYCVKVKVHFSSADSVNTWSLYQTREVDPQVFAHDSGYSPNGTLTMYLSNGQTVTHSAGAYLDQGTYVPPSRSGHTALVYRASNPGALQDFIDQYRDQTDEAVLTVTVGLRDVSDGSVSSSPVDVQGHASYLDYLGSVNADVPNFNEEFKD